MREDEMKTVAELRAENLRLREELHPLPNGPERLRLWKKAHELLLRAQALEQQERMNPKPKQGVLELF